MGNCRKRAGDLVGTSDARGCGQNFRYDAAGRLLTEDYSPCTSNHALYSPPQATSDGYEVFYQYDAVPADFPRYLGVPANYGTASGQYSTRSPTLHGRLAAVHDRAASTWFQYDARGRAVQTARRIGAAGGSSVTIIGTRYRARWYYKNTSFDAADRPVSETTGATQLLGTDGTSAVTTEYTHRGTVKLVGSSYGPLVDKIERDAEGKVNEVTYGDIAHTKTHSSYDTRRRLSSVQTYRSPPQLWSATPAAYSPAPTPDAEVPTTFQPLLEDLDYSYDVVNNPVEIRDWRTPADWPNGSQPVTRRFEYDDLYRVTRADYEYPGGSDIAVSPYAAEMSGQTDRRRPPLVGHKLLPNRPLWQTYNYDWLGNTTSTDDDAHAFYDRSLGGVAHGVASKPYQLTAASQPTSAGPNSGSITTVSYDEAGNLLAMKVNRTATSCDLPGKCTLHSMHYEWDEVGRLSRANHLEGGTGVNPTFFYVYDFSDERVVREDATTATRKQTLYIFDSLEIRGTELQGNPSEYPLTADNEVPILAAHGMRLGRIVKEPDAASASFKGEPQLSLGGSLPQGMHLFLELADHLGSTSIVVDHATSELVEARTYQPYGATESDYRPERWKGFREDYGFTGKEEDVEVGLIYFGKRFLSPYLGSWISADPLAVHVPGRADLNLYAYVKGAVLKNIDPVGLESYSNELGGETTVTQASPDGPWAADTIPEVTIEVGRAGTSPASQGGGAGGQGPVAYNLSDVESAWKDAQLESDLTGRHVPVTIPFTDSSWRADDSVVGGIEGRGATDTVVPHEPVAIGKTVGHWTNPSTGVAEEMPELLEAGVPNPGRIGIAAAAKAGGSVRGMENIARFDSLVEARAAARQLARLGDGTVKYLSEVGPMRGQVVGSASPDGLRGWRIDFDQTKGYHVNWWDKADGVKRSDWTYGANIIKGGTEGDFLNFLQHLQ